MAQRVFDLPFLLVEGLGREHVPVELGDEVRRVLGFGHAFEKSL